MFDMARYFSGIKVKKVLHLENFSITVSDEAPNLIITGKNGSGKTILLNAIAGSLDDIRTGVLALNQNGGVEIGYEDFEGLCKDYAAGEFMLAFYQADRKVKMVESRVPTKPLITERPEIKATSTDQFLLFLSDLKIQEALARNEGMKDDADKIRDWFDSFEDILKEIYEDPELNLTFNYRDYSFHISSEGKTFKFTELSDGFTAIIDIVADLILKMQSDKSLTRVYDKPGIVLVDEIDTHLHMSLQKDIMKILSKVFPRVQFIITTHSPFVLNSLENATAFDMESRKEITDLTEYSFETLAEGYFGVKAESSYIGTKLDILKSLLSKEIMTPSELAQAKDIAKEFDAIPEMIAPAYVGEFRQLMIMNAFKLN